MKITTIKNLRGWDRDDHGNKIYQFSIYSEEGETVLKLTESELKQLKYLINEND